MRNFNICLMVVLLVGCGTMPSTDVDGGVLPDASTTDVMVVQDAGADVSASADSGADAGMVPDAGVPDSGTDTGSSSDAGMPDAGTAEAPDAGTDTGSATDAGVGTIVDLGVSGDGSCLLTSNSEMWCWGRGSTTPVYVSDAVELNGTCGVALDGHAFCWGDSGITSYVGTDVAVLGVQAYASRPTGEVMGLGGSVAPWAPPVPVASMPAQFCEIDIGGGLTCWDFAVSPSRFINHWVAVESSATTDVTDAARRGSLAANDIVVCWTWDGGVQCSHSRGTTGSSLFADATEVEIAGGRACAVVPVNGPLGDHPAGVYCTADRPATFGSPGHWPLNPLPAGDALNTYTDVEGTHLAVGANHSCIMQGENIVCWGANNRGQLGNGTMVSSRVPVSIVW